MPPKAHEGSPVRATSRGRKAAASKKSIVPPNSEEESETKPKPRATSRTRAKANPTKVDKKSRPSKKSTKDESETDLFSDEGEEAVVPKRRGRPPNKATATASPIRKTTSKTPSTKKSSQSKSAEPASKARATSKKAVAKKAPVVSDDSDETSDDDQEPVATKRGVKSVVDSPEPKSHRGGRAESIQTKGTKSSKSSPSPKRPKSPKLSTPTKSIALSPPKAQRPPMRNSLEALRSAYAQNGGAGAPLRSNQCDVKPILAIAFYFVTSIGTVLLNKYLLDGSLAQLTIFLTWVQLTFSVVVTFVIGAVESIFSQSQSQPQSQPESQTTWSDFFSPLLATLPASLVFCLMLILNNLCLSYVHVAFYQVARSWTILISVVLTYLLFGETKSAKQLICCVIIVGGYVAACEGELPWSQLWTELQELLAKVALYAQYYINPISLTPAQVIEITSTVATPPVPAGTKGSILLGLISGFLSCIFVAYNSIVNRQLQKDTTLTRNQIVGALNLNAAVVIFIFMIFNGELNKAINTEALWQSSAILPLIVVSVFGHLLGLATQLQIQYTSPLGHNVSGTAKASVQSIIAWWLKPTQLSTLTIAGTAATILGCGLYSIVPGPAPTPTLSPTPASASTAPTPPESRKHK